MAGTGGSKQWQQVEALVRRLEPEIIEVFRSRDIEPAVASRILEEVVTLLLYRWGQVARPEIWLMEMVRTRAERHCSPPEG